ncbi:hypothetical protein [Nonomuraea africana]|uniref:Uncharacterized protein n=1 Tax=Nonomuraea africana TaxID=46171 RepID=A0ABR9KT06_9ACTN|nr:hypothetical protein [Nonomuraea africana]MBE1565173.1 hypothetical protein [Nonomuraea africana]
MIEIDGPFYRVSDSGFEMLIPRWEGHDPETADQADATITLPDGTRRYATFMTLGVVSGIMDRWRDTGECLNGQYFWCSDLIIIREPGFVSMIDAVRDMIATGEIESACRALPIDDSDQYAD